MPDRVNLNLLHSHVMPECIAYVTGELIDDQHSLVRLVDDILQNIPGNTIGHLIVDEVTYIRDWDKGIKYLADAGRLENMILFLTGSDLLVIKESRMRLPARRGSSDLVDFHLYPLNFLAVCKDPEGGSRLVESVVVSHYRQYFPTYYIKGAGEVDLAYVDQQRFWPVEVKWSGQLRPKDLKQIAKYHKGRILTKSLQSGSILGRPTSPLPLDLLRLGAQPRPENR